MRRRLNASVLSRRTPAAGPRRRTSGRLIGARKAAVAGADEHRGTLRPASEIMDPQIPGDIRDRHPFGASAAS